MTQVLESALDDFRETFTGQVIMPTDSAYGAARVVWNAEIDRHPAMIARCLTTADVSAAVIFARQHGREISVRGGAHNMSGSAVDDDGLMIDLSQLRGVIVDPAGRRARVGGGALLADMDAATQAHGLATPAGLVSHTGVGGLSLGGGMGWLTRKFGMAIDNLIAAEIVVADGRILRAAADENPELFWAIRGGGGNFGVVTSFEFQLHKVGPLIEFGLFFWGLEEGTEVLRMARQVISTLPRDVNAVIAGLNAPPAPFVPGSITSAPGMRCWSLGSARPTSTRRLQPKSEKRYHRCSSLSRQCLMSSFSNCSMRPMRGAFSVTRKGCYVDGLSDDAIAVITDQLPRKSSPQSVLLFYRLDGAYSQVGDDDTAFSGGRSPRYAIFMSGLAATAELLPADRAWVRSFWDALRPYAIGIGSYVNGMAEFEEDRVRASYGVAKYQRLAKIKAKYDPDNVFHRNANIKPSLTNSSTPRATMT